MYLSEINGEYSPYYIRVTFKLDETEKRYLLRHRSIHELMAKFKKYNLDRGITFYGGIAIDVYLKIYDHKDMIKKIQEAKTEIEQYIYKPVKEMIYWLH